jgi:hypothetical protein
VSVNEEADNPRRTPGRAGVLSTLLLVVTYVLVAVSAIAFAGTGTGGIGLGNPDNADDIFAAVGPAVFGDNTLGHALEILLLVSVLTWSASARWRAHARLQPGGPGVLPRADPADHGSRRAPGAGDRADPRGDVGAGARAPAAGRGAPRRTPRTDDTPRQDLFDPTRR